MSDINLRILLTANNQTSSAIRAVTGDLGGMNTALLGVGIGAAALAVGIGVKAVQAAAEYQTAMTRLQNTTGSSDDQMKQYTATIRSLSDTTGKAQTDLAAGMYQIVSANFAGADATKILTTATQAAIIAGADQTKVTTGLVVTLNAFGLKANQVDSVSNRMFKTLSLGRGQMNDLAGALQTGGALVAHYGVSVTDMDATLATLSTGGMKTFGTSMTGLTQLLNVMDGKTDLITGRMHKLHIAFDEGKFKAMSYTDQIAYLNEAFKGHEKQMVAVLGSKQAATALGILGTQSSLLASNLKKLGDTQELAKEKTSAWSKVQGDFNFQWEKFKTNMQNLLIDLGLKLLPYLTPIVKQFSDWATNLQYSFVPWLRNAVDSISQFIGWLQQGSAGANAFKALMVGIGAAIAEIKIYQFGVAAVTAFNNAKDSVSSFLSWMAKIGPASTTSAAEVTGASTIEEADFAAVGASAEATAGEVSGIGAAATASEAEVAVAGTSMLGIFGAIAGVVGGLVAAISTIGPTMDTVNSEGTNWWNHINVNGWYPFGQGNPYADGTHGEVPHYPPNSEVPPKPRKAPTHYGPRGFASGVANFSGGLAYVHAGEVLSNLAPGTSVTPANRVSLGGHTFVFNISTMAGSRAEIVRMVDLLEAEIAQRFRSQTSYGFGGVV